MKIKTREVRKFPEPVLAVDAFGCAISGSQLLSASGEPLLSHSAPLTALASNGEFSVVGGADGQLILTGGRGGTEKRIEGAHKGAVTSIRFASDGASLVSASADGSVKLWSRGGMLRSQLAQLSTSVRAVAVLSGTSDVFFAADTHVHRKSLQTGTGATAWRAHETPVVALAEASGSGSGVLATASESGEVKLWDAETQTLLSSCGATADATAVSAGITSLAFSPGSGAWLAVGCFGRLAILDAANLKVRLCEAPLFDTSAFALAWTPEGAGLVVGLASGAVAVANFCERKKSWGELEASVDEAGVFRVGAKISEQISDPVLDFSVAFGVPVVLTKQQVIFWVPSEPGDFRLAPTSEELKTPALALIPGPTAVAVLDASGCVQVVAHDRRRLATVRVGGAGGRAAALCEDALAWASAEAVTVADAQQTSGKTLGECRHGCAVKTLAFSAGQAKTLAFTDVHKELWLCSRAEGWTRAVKLSAGPVEDFAWHTEQEVLATVGDGKFSVYLNPSIVFTDASLLAVDRQQAAVDRQQAAGVQVDGTGSSIADFQTTSFATVRRTDGSLEAVELGSPQIFLLLKLVSGGRLAEACRLCRFLKSGNLWKVLAGEALRARDLETLQTALTALTDIPKLDLVTKALVSWMDLMVSTSGRSDDAGKELLVQLLSRKPEEAVATLLSGVPKRLFRALRTLMKLQRWEQALDLALQQQSHVDTVLAYRARWLADIADAETNPKFLELNRSLGCAWTPQVAAKVQAEKDKERAHLIRN